MHKLYLNIAFKVIFKKQFSNLRYFNFEPSFILRWYRARDLYESQIPMITG